MYVVCVTVQVKSGMTDQFIEATRDNAQNTRNEPGNHRFDVLQAEEDTNRFFLYEAYRQKEDFAAHQKTEHYLRWRETVRGKGAFYEGLATEQESLHSACDSVGADLVAENGYPEILLFVNSEAYQVATECNGFGLITSCGLLAFLVVLTGKESFVWKLILIFSAGLVGYLLNIVRIIVICAVAPRFPDHYLLTHEIIGTATLWLGVGITWWLVSPSAPQFLRRRREVRS